MMILLTILALCSGLLYGICQIDVSLISMISENSDIVLYLLMFSVGISVGMYEGVMKKIREYHIRIFIIPVGIIARSMIGGVLCSFLLKMPWQHGTAIASGMGWYSLAGASIGKLGGRRTWQCRLSEQPYERNLFLFSNPSHSPETQ